MLLEKRQPASAPCPPAPTRLAGVQRRQWLESDVLLGNIRLSLPRPVGGVWQDMVKRLAAPACGRAGSGAGLGWLLPGAGKRCTGGGPQHSLGGPFQQPPARVPGRRSTPICCIHSSLARHQGSHPTITPLQRQAGGEGGVRE